MGSSETKQPGQEGAVGKLLIGGVTFLWKIENYSKIPLEQSIKSSSFAVFGISYHLNLHRSGDLYVKLHRGGSSTQPSNFQSKICVVDRHGQENHTKIKEVVMEKGSDDLVLMKILEADLQRREEDILPMDTLTVSVYVTFLGGIGNVEHSKQDSAMFLETLSNDLGRFYQAETDADCVLKTDTKQFPAHRAVLSARSTVFADMFRQETNENRLQEIDIKDIETETLKDLLYYLYTSKINELSADNAASMYVAAQRFALLELKDKCLKSFISNLTIDNICKAAIIADMHNEPTLRNAVIRYIKDKSEDVLNSDEWENFFNENPRLGGSILKAAVIGDRSKRSS